MPLDKSKSPAAFKRNVSTLMGEVGKSPRVKSEKQALAIAYSIKRRGKADGGAISRLPDHYAEVGSSQIEDRRDNDPTLRAMGMDKLKKRFGMKHSGAMMDSQRTEAEVVDRLVPRRADGGAVLAPGFYAYGGSPYPQMMGQPMAAGGTPQPQQGFNPIAQLIAQSYSPVQRVGHEDNDRRTMKPEQVRGFAMGGTPWEVKAESRGMVPHSGYIPGPTGGRSDTVPMGVKKGSYVVPADILSGLGGGNSAAGASAMNKMFNMGPYGAAMPKIGKAPKPHFLGVQKTAKPIRQRFADGGMENDESPIADIVASHGEMVIPPEKLVEKFGDLDHAHEIMDKFVGHVRKKTIKTLKRIPPPKKN